MVSWHPNHGAGCPCAINDMGPIAQSFGEMDFMRSACAAAQSGDMGKLSRIISKCPESIFSDGANGGSGYTPLHYAARAGRIEVVKLLLQHGAVVDALTKAGQATPLHRAAALGHTKVVEELISAGANGLLQDSDGETALHKAASAGHVDTCQLLISLFPMTANSLDKHGKTPCDRAAASCKKLLYT
ncbi:hypothetical protein CEUSTIGMA_g11442.t1 [Chlamydomonas eustigma]|uniref:Uncharacterized protein n=1 Tax=Chlamydomonas eustigma TaxID=1157962 RepID=A0A250XLS5_9CHLO|nr:hypothetical protein CEUSTIGMA_g11442.t1 [Chlamydomonas eustigma]|eukprot:GAX84017.1 hypothetical protein CEUSTIGMA_g11442.t1 [Chlamydomonas eustigma]